MAQEKRPTGASCGNCQVLRRVRQSSLSIGSVRHRVKAGWQNDQLSSCGEQRRKCMPWRQCGTTSARKKARLDKDIFGNSPSTFVNTTLFFRRTNYVIGLQRPAPF